MLLSFVELAMRLDGIIEAARIQLRAISEENASAVPAPGKWSKKEILGHLIDSAVNNEQRLIRARDVQQLTFPPYDQEAWVRAHGYAERGWSELRELWQLINKDMVEVLRRMPMTSAGVKVRIGDSEPTIRFIAGDYVRHLVHHLEQIGCVQLPYEQETDS